MKKEVKRVKKRTTESKRLPMAQQFSMYAVLVALFTVPSSANGLLDSELGSGLVKLIQDAGGAMIFIAPISGLAVVAYFLIRKSMAETQDELMWKKRITVAICCSIAAMVSGAIIKMIADYFV